MARSARSFSTPRLSGFALASFARLARSRMGRLALERILRGELNVGALAALPDSLRGELPIDTRPLQARPPRTPDDARLPLPKAGAWARGSDAFAAAYRARSTTPRDVVVRALEQARELAASSPPMGPLGAFADRAALEEAEASTTRHRQGRPRGPFDGVPFVVKEEIAVRGLPRQGGTSFLDRSPCEGDATCVARLRAAGAIVLGQTVMTEYGMTPLGANSKRIMPRNPHATDYVAGGSSTGSSVAVATGLVPFALGSDGGGSIRIPAAMTGVFGIKPTWGRVSRDGDLGSGSVTHLGPIASTTLDLARTLEAIGAPDPKDSQTLGAPSLPDGSLVAALGRGVRGLRIAIDEREWRDATSGVARAGEDALAQLEAEGAKIARVHVPLARFAGSIGYVVLGIEARAALREAYRDHADEMSHDLQVSLAAVEGLSALDYADALRLRSGLRRQMQAVFGEADLFALPTTARAAVRVTDAEMQSGFVDAGALDAFCRFAFLGNLTGLPASSAPVGKDAAGLPIGLQLMGDAFDEATVLAATAHLERIGAARVERPRVVASVLGA